MKLAKSAAYLSAVMLILAFSNIGAKASDAVCANPQSVAEEAICDDSYLMGLSLQINNVLYNFIAWREPGGKLPEAQQIQLGHYWIGLEDCAGAFRCMESEMRNFLSSMEGFYLDDEDTILTSGRGVPFQLHQSQDSPGSDLLKWNDKRNFGWSQRLCQYRCAANDQCAVAGFDVLQIQHNLYGYCTMKSKVSLPLKSWTPSGVLLIKK